MAKMKTYFLIINGDKSARVTTRNTAQAGQVVLRVNVTFPASWDGVVGDVNVTLPERDLTIESELQT